MLIQLSPLKTADSKWNDKGSDTFHLLTVSVTANNAAKLTFLI